MPTVEVNFDGLAGPTHNYARLSPGNVASASHRGTTSNPKAAALQGLEKMKYLADLGIGQGILPPQERPHIPTLRQLGFRGTDSEILNTASQHAPEILAACSSAGSMWAATAATVTSSADARDGRAHFTAAHLTAHFHGSLEARTTQVILRQIFPEGMRFAHHLPLPPGPTFSDEGAANHIRLCADYDGPRVHLFVYGRHAGKSDDGHLPRFPGRQTFEASEAICRIHSLSQDQVAFARQNQEAIDAGAFQNDVVATGNQNLFLFHEQAYAGCAAVVNQLADRLARLTGQELVTVEAPTGKLPLADAVGSFVFNSQIVTLPARKMALLAPVECQEFSSARGFLAELGANPRIPIGEVHYID
jgi:succinylarginine dihydrolase